MAKMEFTAWIIHNESKSAESLADEAIRRYPDLAHRLMVDEIDRRRRQHVRRGAQKEAIPAVHKLIEDLKVAAKRQTGASPLRPNAFKLPREFDDLRKAKVALGDGSHTTYGQMTVAQHKIRIGMLSDQLSGIQKTRQMHERIVYLLESNGANCLDDLTAVENAA